MDKLDQILHAEDRATKELDAAREQARSVLAQAKSESGLIANQAEHDAREEAARYVEGVRATTVRESQEEEQRSAARMRTEIEAAEQRVDQAVRAVVEELAD